MYAVIQTGGKQYVAKPGEALKVEKVMGEVGDRVSFDKVLLTSDGETVNVGKPYLDNVKVMGQIVRQGKDAKVIVFKYKKRKGYRRKQGHRQLFTLVKVEDIEI